MHRKQKAGNKKKQLTYEDMIRREIKKVDYPNLNEFVVNSPEKNYIYQPQGMQRPGAIKNQAKY